MSLAIIPKTMMTSLFKIKYLVLTVSLFSSVAFAQNSNKYQSVRSELSTEEFTAAKNKLNGLNLTARFDFFYSLVESAEKLILQRGWINCTNNQEQIQERNQNPNSADLVGYDLNNQSEFSNWELSLDPMGVNGFGLTLPAASNTTQPMGLKRFINREKKCINSMVARPMALFNEFVAQSLDVQATAVAAIQKVVNYFHSRINPSR